MDEENNDIADLSEALEEAADTSDDNSDLDSGQLATRDGDVITTDEGGERYTG